MTRKDIADIIKQSRLSAGLTQSQVAEKLGRPQQTIANWEVGRTQPDANTLFELFRVLGRSVDEAFGFKQEKAPPMTGEAIKLGRDYDTLDSWGQKQVRTVADNELARVNAAVPTESSANPITALPRAKRRSDGFSEIKVYEQPAAAGLGNYLDEPPFHMEQYPANVIPEKADFGVVISGNSMEPEIHDGGTVFVQGTPNINAGEVGIFVLDGRAYCKMLAVDHDRRQVQLLSINPAYDPIPVGADADLYTLGRVLGQWTPGLDHYQP